MLILAPMEGLTELLFRRAYHQCFPGAFDYAISPFISLTHGNLADAEKKIDDVLPARNVDSMPVIPQLLGHEPSEFVMLSNRLYELGFTEINWNIGCPMRRVAGKHRGSGILPYPDEVRRLLDVVIPQMRPRLSIKMRLGYRDNHEIDQIIPILNDYPLASVIVHPRIGKQMYGGQPDLERFAEVLPLIKHPVIYNGDICTVYDYGRIRSRFPQVHDVMIGRGALYNPLLPMEIRATFPADFGGVTSFSASSSGSSSFSSSSSIGAATTSVGTGTSVGAAITDGAVSSIVSDSVGASCTAGEFVMRMAQDIMALEAKDLVKIRKLKEYWCLLNRALPGSESQKRSVLHASTVEETYGLIVRMVKDGASS